MKSIVELKWISLVAYVIIEQLFLATFRRFDFGYAVFWPLIASTTQLFLQMYQVPFLARAEELGLLLPVVVDAAINVGILVLAINLSNPSHPNLISFFEIASLVLIAASNTLILWKPSTNYPLKAVLTTGTWEQVRLLTSFLFLRISAGSPLQAILLAVSKDWELRIGVQRSGFNLDMDEPSSDLKGGTKTQKKFAVNLNLCLIIGGAVVVLAAGLIGGLYLVAVKASEAFA
jgi:hypothetical protein